jgi:hypothetical protein
MNLRGIFLGAACGIVGALVSVHIFFNSQPEFYRAVSSDGVLVLEGSVYESQAFFLQEEVSNVASVPFFLTRYTLLPRENIFVEPLVATLPNNPDDILYFIDSVQGYAVPLEPHTFSSHDTSFLLVRGGTYAVGDELRIDAPTFIDVIANMRSHLPLDAVSYHVRMVATPKDGLAVLLRDTLEAGGCGGVPFVSQDIVTAQEQRIVQVLVNDVLTETAFTFLMDIGVTPAGCPEDMPLQVIF